MINTDSRIRLFSRSGNPLADILAKPTCSWVLNGVGTASFKIPYKYGKWQRTLFEFGNLLLIETNNLPPWGGVIDGAREWGMYEATVNARSAEHLFSLRSLTVPYSRTAHPGDHFKTLVYTANQDEDTLIDPGIVTGEGYEFLFEASYIQISNAIENILETSGFDYAVIPFVDDYGRLSFRANLYQKRISSRKTVLREGYNLKIGTRSLTEYPPKANEIVGYGNAAKGRVTYSVENKSSQTKYRLRQRCVSATSNTLAEVASIARAALALDALKQNVFGDLIALNKVNTFSDLNIGNVLPVEFVNYGWGLETNARIVYMQFTGGLDEVKLTCEEYTND